MSKPNTTLPVLNAISLDRAREQFKEVDTETGIIPDDGRYDILAAIDELTASAKALNVTTMGGLCDQIDKILQHAAKVENIKLRLRTVDANRLHRLRNVALSWAIACALDLDEKADPVIGLFPKLQERTTDRDRLRTTDEILLLRAAALDRLRCTKSIKSAGVYAMVDAGAVPVETTAITPGDFDVDDDDDDPRPTLMLVPHYNKAIVDRSIDLDRYASYVLGRVLSHAREAGTSRNDCLTYTSRDGRDNAPSATTSSILSRLAASVGVRHDDTVPASIRRWRIQTTFDHHGADAAVAISGEATDRLPRLINIPDDAQRNPETPIVTSFLAA